MRYTLVLALFCCCLCATPAAADPLTKPNNDATLRVRHLRTDGPSGLSLPPPRRYEPRREDAKPER